MYYKNNTLNRDTNESSSTASVTPAISNVNTDTTRSITLGYQAESISESQSICGGGGGNKRNLRRDFCGSCRVGKQELYDRI